MGGGWGPQPQKGGVGRLFFGRVGLLPTQGRGRGTARGDGEGMIGLANKVQRGGGFSLGGVAQGVERTQGGNLSGIFYLSGVFGSW